jgi:hypothetical protein
LANATAVAPATIAHRLPGRVRLRLPRSHRSPSLMAKVRNAITALAGVARVMIEPATGSILVEHDRSRTTLDMIAEALEQTAGLPLHMGEAHDNPGPSMNGRAPLARAATRTTSTIDDTIRRATGGLFSLRLLVPLTLAGLAIYQFQRTGTGLLAPPYTLLWYAFSLFMTFNVK